MTIVLKHLRRGALMLALLGTTSVTSAVGKWQYEADTDGMTGLKIVSASVGSSNQHRLSFPYQGGTSARLTIRQRGDDEPDIFLVLNRGQFMCGRTRCKVLVKFDDDDALDYSGIGASDGSTEVVFIQSESIFMDKVPSAKRLKVEALLFREGTRIFEFDVSGLSWPPPPKPTAKAPKR